MIFADVSFRVRYEAPFEVRTLRKIRVNLYRRTPQNRQGSHVVGRRCQRMRLFLLPHGPRGLLSLRADTGVRPVAAFIVFPVITPCAIQTLCLFFPVHGVVSVDYAVVSVDFVGELSTQLPHSLQPWRRATHVIQSLYSPHRTNFVLCFCSWNESTNFKWNSSSSPLSLFADRKTEIDIGSQLTVECVSPFEFHA